MTRIFLNPLAQEKKTTLTQSFLGYIEAYWKTSLFFMLAPTQKILSHLTFVREPLLIELSTEQTLKTIQFYRRLLDTSLFNDSLTKTKRNFFSVETLTTFYVNLNFVSKNQESCLKRDTATTSKSYNPMNGKHSTNALQAKVIIVDRCQIECFVYCFCWYCFTKILSEKCYDHNNNHEWKIDLVAAVRRALRSSASAVYQNFYNLLTILGPGWTTAIKSIFYWKQTQS